MESPFGSFRRLRVVGILRKHSGTSSAAVRERSGADSLPRKRSARGLPRLAAARVRGGGRDQKQGLVCESPPLLPSLEEQW